MALTVPQRGARDLRQRNSHTVDCAPAHFSAKAFADCFATQQRLADTDNHDREVMMNGKHACEHTCKDKRSCKHRCCRMGVNPKRATRIRKTSGARLSFAQVNIQTDDRLQVQMSIPQSICMAGIGLLLFVVIVVRYSS